LVTSGDLHPALSRERLALLERQKEFLRLRGFLAADVDLLSWIDPAPLGAARAIVSARSEHASLGGSR
jgi:hypothetical protein